MIIDNALDYQTESVKYYVYSLPPYFFVTRKNYHKDPATLLSISRSVYVFFEYGHS